MLSKKVHDQKACELSKTLQKKIKDLFNMTYGENLKSEKRKIDFYSFIYPDEVLFVFSLVSTVNDVILPISFFISLDLEEGQLFTVDEESIASNQLMSLIIDQSSHFFDDYFGSSAEEKDDCYTENWQPLVIDSKNLFYRISRENIQLFLMAEKILGSSEQL